MEKVLNQEEIDAMLRAARGGADNGDAAPAAQPWDAREAGLLGKEQVRAISQLHETFARNLTHSLGAYLRVVFGAALVSAENLAYREFLGRLPEVTYLASFRLVPLGAVAVLHLDHAIAYPIIDLLLGGEGVGKPPTRDTTEIEDNILESVSKIICRELEEAWQALRLAFVFQQRLAPPQVGRLLPSEEKTLSLNFEITVKENRGTLTVAFPAVVSNAMLRKLANESAYQRPRATEESASRLRKRLQTAIFPAQLELTGLAVPVRKVLGLKPGEILELPLRADSPAQFSVAGRSLFTATPVRSHEVRAANILGAVGAGKTGGETGGEKIGQAGKQVGGLAAGQAAGV